MFQEGDASYVEFCLRFGTMVKTSMDPRNYGPKIETAVMKYDGGLVVPATCMTPCIPAAAKSKRVREKTLNGGDSPICAHRLSTGGDAPNTW